MTILTKTYATIGAAFTMGMLAASPVHAGAGGGAGAALTPVATTEYGADSGFSQVFERLTVSFGGLPGLISMASYLMGIIFAIGGILKLKDHVEAPDKHPMKDAAVRLAVGGALFALPYIMTLMTQSIGDPSQTIGPAQLNEGSFSIKR